MVTRDLQTLPSEELLALVENWQLTLTGNRDLLTEPTKALLRTRISEVEGILWTRGEK